MRKAPFITKFSWALGAPPSMKMRLDTGEDVLVGVGLQTGPVPEVAPQVDRRQCIAAGNAPGPGGLGHRARLLSVFSMRTQRHEDPEEITRCFFVSLCLCVFVVGLCGIAKGQDVQITASAGSDVVGVQDNFQLTITVSGRDSGEAETPRLPRLNGFQVVAGPNVGTQFQWVNGVSSSSKSFTYILLPEKEGQFTIDPVEVTVRGKIYKTQPISILVTPGSSRPLAPPRRRSFDPFGDDDTRAPRYTPSGEEILVVAELDRSTAYPGQQVTLIYHLLTQVGITGLQLKESPPLTGFWVEDLQVDSSPAPVRRVFNGREYLDYVVKKLALFANAPGNLTVPPTTFAISVKVPGDFFGLFGQSETVYRKTREALLEVRPFPAQGRPESFSNAVGSFSLMSSLDKSEAATGDAVALRVTLAGRGNLKTIADLPMPAMQDFTIYSSKRAENVRPVEGDIIGGEKTWEYVIVPKAPGAQKIPSFGFSYFDPESGKYQTLSTSPLELKVVRGSRAGDALTTLSGISKQSVTRQGTDINFIKLSAGDLETRRAPVYQSVWFYVAAAIPLLFNIGAFLYQRERLQQNANVVLARSRKARRTALARLKRAARSGKTEARRFYDEAALALSGYLTDKFNLPEIAVTGDTLERTLTERSLHGETVKEIIACLQECDFARFVSASGSTDKMRGLAGRIRNIIDSLERT